MGCIDESQRQHMLMGNFAYLLSQIFEGIFPYVTQLTGKIPFAVKMFQQEGNNNAK